MGRVSKPDGIRLLREFIKRHRVEFPVALIEREQAVESGVHAYPTLYLLDREGIIRDFTVGHTHFDRFGSRIRSLNRLSQPAKRRVKPTGQ
jgi:hypothetical protein